MLHLLQILNLIFHLIVGLKGDDPDRVKDLGGGLISELRNDANLDLTEDEEYEDLRAEFLAYHSALASLVSKSGRRSMVATPCWKLSGICINHNLCVGFNSISQVPGCKDKLKVCCFVWNQYNVRDMKEHDLDTLAFPWSMKKEFAKGKGVISKEPVQKLKKKKRDKKKLKKDKKDNIGRSIAFVFYK